MLRSVLKCAADGIKISQPDSLRQSFVVQSHSVYNTATLGSPEWPPQQQDDSRNKTSRGDVYVHEKILNW